MIPKQLVGRARDERDWFPFEHHNLTDNHFRPTSFTFLEYIENVWRRRWCTCNYTNSLGSGSFDFQMWSSTDFPGLPVPGQETEILPRGRLYDDILYGTGVTTFDGTQTIVVYFAWNYYGWNPDIFAPAVNITIATDTSSTLIPGDPSYNSSTTVVTLFGKNIPMGVTSPLNDVGGTLEIVPRASGDGFWGWDGHFDTTTGALVP